MDLKQREEAARQIAASVKDAIGRIVGDRTAADQVVPPKDGADDSRESPAIIPKT